MQINKLWLKTQMFLKLQKFINGPHIKLNAQFEY